MAEQPISILMVEDSATEIAVASMWLETGMRTEYELITRTSLEGALDVIAARPLDVIVLDLNLPDSLGLDTFHTVHRHAGNTAIVIVSSESEEEVAIEAVRHGAQDYIVKHADSQSTMLTRTIRFALERVRREKAESTLLSTRQQLEIARRIQQQLYPSRSIHFRGIDIVGRCDPADEAGGDYFDYFAMPDDSIGFVIGDVSGHGIGPAMLMVETRAILRTLSRQSIDVGGILTEVNQILADDVEDGLFVTAFFGCFDQKRQQLRYACAGHPGRRLNQHGDVTMLDSEHLPLGISPDEVYQTHTVSVGENDLFVLYTDGLSEAMNDAMELLGDGKILQAVSDKPSGTAREIIAAMFDLADQHSRRRLPVDDRTALVMRLQQARAVPPHHLDDQHQSRAQEDSQVSSSTTR